MIKGCNRHERERRGHEVLVGNHEGNLKLARLRNRLKYDIKICFQSYGMERSECELYRSG
jgi:hypothetical protein